jgi:hypothetical protein
LPFVDYQEQGKEISMKNAIYALLFTAALAQTGCSPQFWGGTALGALGAGGGYEYNNKRQMDNLEDDYRAGRIGREEYNDRKRQIERGSIIY